MINFGLFFWYNVEWITNSKDKTLSEHVSVSKTNEKSQFEWKSHMLKVTNIVSEILKLLPNNFLTF